MLTGVSGTLRKQRRKQTEVTLQFLSNNPATRNRTRDHLIAADFYSQMLYQLSYSRLSNTKAVCPSGLRGWTQVPLARAAWVQIPQLSFSQF